MSGLTVILIPESLDKDALKLVEDSCNPPFAYKGLLNLHEPESRLAALIVEEVKVSHLVLPPYSLLSPSAPLAPLPFLITVRGKCRRRVRGGERKKGII